MKKQNEVSQLFKAICNIEARKLREFYFINKCVPSYETFNTRLLERVANRMAVLKQKIELMGGSNV